MPPECLFPPPREMPSEPSVCGPTILSTTRPCAPGSGGAAARLGPVGAVDSHAELALHGAHPPGPDDPWPRLAPAGRERDTRLGPTTPSTTSLAASGTRTAFRVCGPKMPSAVIPSCRWSAQLRDLGCRRGEAARPGRSSCVPDLIPCPSRAPRQLRRLPRERDPGLSRLRQLGPVRVGLAPDEGALHRSSQSSCSVRSRPCHAQPGHGVVRREAIEERQRVECGGSSHWRSPSDLLWAYMRRAPT